MVLKGSLNSALGKGLVLGCIQCARLKMKCKQKALKRNIQMQSTVLVLVCVTI